jgi:homoserine dehydrogenase
MAEPRNVALMGLGTVGRGVADLLGEWPTTPPVRIAALTVGNPGKPGHASFVRRHAAGRCPLPEAFTPVERLAETAGLDLLIDVTGGGREVADAMIAALKRGRDVVTANKAALSRYGREIFAAAAAPGAGRLAFEAAVGGGVPIIRTLSAYLAHDTVDSVAGICNGTSNFILGGLAAGRPFAEVLAEAVALGYAEPGGGADVSGEDAGHKLIILSRLAFGAALHPDQVMTSCVRGIAGVDAVDFRYARERLGRDIKSLAVAERLDASAAAGTANVPPARRLAFRVTPVMLPSRSVLAQVRANYNGFLVNARSAGRQFLSGPGAGQRPTAHAVLADVVDLVSRPGGPHVARVPGPLGVPPEQPWELVPLARQEFDLCYVRFFVANAPGIVGAIAEAFGRRGVHLHEVLQLEHTKDELRALAGPAGPGNAARMAVEAGDALAFAVTLNRCPFGHIESVIEALSSGRSFRNLLPPVALPCEDRIADLQA